MILGLDTSCYTTSAAAVARDGRVLVSARKLLPVEAGERGLRQSEAVFTHIRQLPDIIDEAMRQAHASGEALEAVCASARPRDENDSYMPVFMAGVCAGRAAASAVNVPFYTCAHQTGHILAASCDLNLPESFVAAHVSGGTTEILHIDHMSLRLIGGSDDLHAGQLVDRVGVKLGLPFPCGPHLEALVGSAVPHAQIPASVHGTHMNLSGAENMAVKLLTQGEDPAVVATEIYDVLSRSLCRVLVEACALTGTDTVLVAGGVASSALLRRMMAARMQKRAAFIHLHFGKPEYSGDNAVGAALSGLRQWKAANS